MYSANTPIPSQHRPTCPHSQPPNKLYFAYGSNMSVAQMAQRCPGSVFKGPAVLDSYRWHINERGVASVLKSDGHHSVEGLLYEITAKDERALDRNEGVSKGFYQKHVAKVSVQPHDQYTDFHTDGLALLLKQLREEVGDDNRVSRRSPWTKVPALVYVSENYTKDGPAREEYIPRMRNAVKDAIFLGMSKPFVNKYIVPYLQQEKKLQEKGPGPEAQDTIAKKTMSRQNSVKASRNKSKTRATEQKVPQSQPGKTGGPASDMTDLLSHDDCLCIFPVEMLEAVDQVRVFKGKMMTDHYIVVERRTAVDTSVSLDVNAPNPRRANQLVMKTFKDILKTELKSLEGRGVVGSLGELAWKMEHRQNLHLKCLKPGEKPWLVVRVHVIGYGCV
ncbi:uncharacterized protein B0J16DRAFT_288262 [Fusarium flagelliforme]|uniref:uncharacterized protein n=1 Tax=Fusarium flagelliforme TaxID=2675880 RepID=UPI001E8E55EF|nr:uncharacterized protein B0J16DRAFT_288262 [Fusarium flagelliforme]KAH7186265.1 hypothetical protein B0J16DRAFT_288262 [Fusarium flagelliforme]